MDSDNSSCEIHDWLSSLPDSLIIEILSLLPMKDVVATMLLSKRWKNLWTTLPCLDFDSCSPDFVSGALARFKGSKIHKFSLECRCDFDSDSDIIHSQSCSAIVDSWLLFAIEKQVEELHVCISRFHTHYCPPQRLYTCSSITTMSFDNCDLIIDEGVAVQWNRLESLMIEGLDQFNDNAILNRILEGAPHLEELTLDCTYFRPSCSIRSTSLKFLELDHGDDTVFDVGELLILAPNLLQLKMYGHFCGTFLLDVPSLTNADIFFEWSLNAFDTYKPIFQSIRRVENLTLSDFSSKALLVMNGLEFPNVKSLSFSVDRAEKMLGALHMFPNLTVLCVRQDRKCAYLVSVEEADRGEVGVIVSHLSKADLPAPSLPYLKNVEISWSMLDVSIVPALEIIFENAMLLDKMEFWADWRDWDGDKPQVVISKPASSRAELIIIHEE